MCEKKIENIIFLDIDGVINNNREEISIEAMAVLKKLIKNNNAKVVVISSWFMCLLPLDRKRKLREFFNENDIEILDVISLKYEGDFLDIKLSERTLGIIDYLKNNPNCNYVILDDEFFNEYKLLNLNYYKTRKWKGLIASDLKKISFRKANTKHLNYVNYYRQPLNHDEKIYSKLINTLKLVEKQKRETM